MILVGESNSSIQSLLTIAIPTYNRIDCLKLLIKTILQQVPSEGVLGDALELLICNNNSTDGTFEYLQEFLDCKGVRVINHPVNCGADENILFCSKTAVSKFIWIMGDDDIPLDGSIGAVLECLKLEQPDILYLPSKWVEGDLSEFSKVKILKNTASTFDRLSLAVRSAEYVTFISSWVFNIDSYNKIVPSPKLDRYSGTSFTQLEWTLSLIKYGRKLLCADETWVIARGGCSGGYSVFEAFSIQYNSIVDDKLSDTPLLHSFFRSCMLFRFIPALIWGVRENKSYGNFGDFDKERVLKTLNRAYSNEMFFGFIVAPMIKLNIPLALCFRFIARIFAKLWLTFWKIRAAV